MTDISRHARDIHDQLPGDADLTPDEIEEELELLVNDYDVPLWEAKRNILGPYLEDSDGSQMDPQDDNGNGETMDSVQNVDPPAREVAKRVFAAEFNDATYTFQEDDGDRAPKYVLLPTGAKANRVFVTGTLTETKDVGTENEYWQGRVVDPTGTFFVYAGEYQPAAAKFLRKTEPPAFVAIVGKPRTYEADDGVVNVSLRPESITIVDDSTRDRWVVETGNRTLDRIEAFIDNESEYTRMAREKYGDDVDLYCDATISALESLD